MKKIGNFRSILFLSITFFSMLAWSQQGTVVSATVDRNKMEVQDTFTLTVKVQSSESVEIDEPRLPSDLSGFDLIQRWENSGVQQSLVQTPTGMDFKTIRKREFHYMFQTKSVGRYSVDAIEVVVNGRLFKTEPVIVEVFQSGQAPSQGRVRPQPGGSGGQVAPDEEEDPEEAFLRQQEDIFNQLLQRQFGGGAGGGLQAPPSGSGKPGRPQVEPQYRSMPTNPNDAFFIQLEVDKTSVYEGEQVTATWYMLTRGQMETLDRVKFPALKGFWKEIIEENPQIQFYDEVINGVPYRKALLASHALFPIKAGKATIDEFTVKSRIRTASRNYGYGRAYEFTKSSKRLEIEVKPLPADGRPASFTGAVGQFNVTSQVEGAQFPVNQPFTLKIRFEGQGNAKAIELPAIEWPAGLEVYDTKNESRFFKDGNSFKQFEVLLIPRKEGALEIPGVHFAIFNPKTAKYESKETGAISLTITPSTGENAAKGSAGSFLGDGKTAAAAQAPKTLPSLIESSNLVRQGGGFNQVFSTGVASAQVAGVWGLWAALMAAIGLGSAALGYRELKPQSRSVSLRKKLDTQWKKVEAAISQSQFKQAGIEIVNSFNLVLSEVSSHKSETQEITKMLDRLSPEKRARIGGTMLTCYEEAQLLGFAPESALGDLATAERVKTLAKNSKQALNEACE